MLTLGQDTVTTTEAAVGDAWWHVLLDNAFALTILFIFLTAVISVIVKLRRKDKCLKLLDGYHVSYLTTAGKALWGDLVVYSQGLELQFDAPYTTRQGVIKTSAVIYETETAECLAICRTEAGLSDRERRLRDRQIRQSFRPGLFRRLIRWIRNIINTLRDAFAKALSALVGQLARARPDSAVLATQQTGVNEIGQTLLFAAGNAYEPILEAHIGTSVVLRIASATEPTKQVLELPGYLVDYTDRYVAVFNVQHEPMERIEWEVTQTSERPNVQVDVSPPEIRITCTGPDVLLVKEVRTGDHIRRLELSLMPGCNVCIHRDDDGPVALVLERTRAVDVVCPRSVATVHFGAETRTRRSARWLGLAPSREAEATQLAENTPGASR